MTLDLLQIMLLDLVASMVYRKTGLTRWNFVLLSILRPSSHIWMHHTSADAYMDHYSVSHAGLLNLYIVIPHCFIFAVCCWFWLRSKDECPCITKGWAGEVGSWGCRVVFSYSTPGVCIKTLRLCIQTSRLHIKTPSLCIETPELHIKTFGLHIETVGLRIETLDLRIETPRLCIETLGLCIETCGLCIEFLGLCKCLFFTCVLSSLLP